MCVGKMLWAGLMKYTLAMSLVQGTNEQGEMCTEGNKVTALRVVTLLRHEMVEREDVIFSQAHGSLKVRLAGVTCKFEGQQQGVPDNHLLALITLALRSSIDAFIKNSTISLLFYSCCWHLGGPRGGR